MLPRILRRALPGLTVFSLASACATGSMTQGEGVEGGLAGDSGDADSGGELPNPDPTFDGVDDGGTGSTGGDDAPSDDDETGSQADDDDSTSSPVEPGDDSTGDDDDDDDDDGMASTGDPTEGGTDGSTGEESPSLDVSGWTLVQTDSARTFELPEGTVLQPGMKIVIGRASSLAGFSAFWNTTFASDVLFFSGLDDFPVINGDETYTLEDHTGAVVDGPTPALTVGTNVQRTNGGMAASDPAAWAVSVDPNLDATPGEAELAPPPAPSVLISEVSDTLGNGAYVHEFVELAYLGH